MVIVHSSQDKINKYFMTYAAANLFWYEELTYYNYSYSTQYTSIPAYSIFPDILSNISEGRSGSETTLHQ